MTNHARSLQRALIPIAGTTLILISLAIRYTTYVSGTAGRLSLSEANGVCSSTLGLLARTQSAHVRSVCSQCATYEDVCGALLLAGIVVVIVGVARMIYKARESVA